jgi:hypothetical protein
MRLLSDLKDGLITYSLVSLSFLITLIPAASYTEILYQATGTHYPDAYAGAINGMAAGILCFILTWSIAAPKLGRMCIQNIIVNEALIIAIAIWFMPFFFSMIAGCYLFSPLGKQHFTTHDTVIFDFCCIHLTLSLIWLSAIWKYARPIIDGWYFRLLGRKPTPIHLLAWHTGFWLLMVALAAFLLWLVFPSLYYMYYSAYRISIALPWIAPDSLQAHFFQSVQIQAQDIYELLPGYAQHSAFFFFFVHSILQGFYLSLFLLIVMPLTMLPFFSY